MVNLLNNRLTLRKAGGCRTGCPTGVPNSKDSGKRQRNCTKAQSNTGEMKRTRTEENRQTDMRTGSTETEYTREAGITGQR